MVTAIVTPKEKPLDHENNIVNPYDDVLSVPPKGFEKVVKSLEKMRDTLKNKRLASSYEIPEDVKSYLQNIHNLEVLPKGFENLPHKLQHQWMRKYYIEYMPTFPQSLSMLAAGMLHPGDNKRDPSEVPDWLDREKFRRGQEVAQKYFFELSFSMLISFFAVYSFQDGLRPVIITKQSTTPFNSFRRYAQTLQIIWTWYTSDPWTKGTVAYKRMQLVRKMHQRSREQCSKKSVQEIVEESTIKKPWCPMREQLIEEFKSVCPASDVLQRPYLIFEDYPKKAKNVNQTDMFVTQFGFIGLPVLYPEKIGMKDISDEDLDAFCHLWKSLGFLLGIYDEYNLCNGSLEEIRQRVRDVTEHWVKPNFTDISPEWEHLLRCMLEGISYYFLKMPFEVLIVILAEIINIPMPRIRASLSLYGRFIYAFITTYTNYLSRVPGVRKIANVVSLYFFKRSWTISEEKAAKLKKKSDELFSKNSIAL